MGAAVEEKFLQLCHDHLRIKYEPLVPPVELNSDMLLWRTMRVRHKKGDFRNSDDEWKSVKRVAQWTLKVNCEIKGQKYTPLAELE